MDKESALKELRRELAMRESVYPNWVAQGKLSQRQADHRVAVMKWVIEQIEGLPEEVEEGDRLQLGLFGEVR